VKAPNGRGLFLVIFDAGDVTDELRRYQLLVEKLITYVDYVATGQYREQAPDLAREDISIRVVCTTPPNDVMRQIVSVVSRKQPEVRLPVVVETEEEFLHSTGVRKPHAVLSKKSWWKFW
jgi:hypothetical protein